MKKIAGMFFIASFFLTPLAAQAEISQADQQAAAQRAYEASASSYNSVTSAAAKVVAKVKRATSNVQVASNGGAAVAVRG